MAFNVKKFLLYDVKLLTMEEVTNFKSTVPFQWTKFVWFPWECHCHRQACVYVIISKIGWQVWRCARNRS